MHIFVNMLNKHLLYSYPHYSIVIINGLGLVEKKRIFPESYWGIVHNNELISYRRYTRGQRYVNCN